MELTELYRPLLLDHARNPRNAGRLEPPALHAAASNPLCGDELDLYLAITDGRITAVRHATRACGVCTASASLLSEWAAGRVTAELVQAVEQLASRLAADSVESALDPGDFAPLLAFRAQPGRWRCVLLPWQALRDAVAAECDARSVSSTRTA